jgi:flagellar biosynthesis/type III secretory pathway chaperone
MVNTLIDIIGKEAALFESFLELLEQQQQMLVENDVDGLTKVTELQREKLIQSQLLNKKRLELVEAIKTANHIDGDLNVTRLLDIVDQTQADRLQRLQKIILDLSDQINLTRNQNAMLLNKSREYIMKTMEMLSRIQGSSPIYSASGDQTDRSRTVAVDRRA